MERLLQNRAACALLALLAAVYLSFLAADLFFAGAGLFSMLMKYLGVLLCFALALLLRGSAWNKKDAALLITALLLTCVSDPFLLLLNLPVPGLLCFCAVHLCYIRRYRPRAFHIAVAIALTLAAGFLAAGLLTNFPTKYALSGLYAGLLITATAFGFASPLPRANRRLVRAGMLLFLLCDLHVALFNTLPADNPYYPFAAFLMWFFYLPSQTLLALSAYRYES